jgi:hypothetical protein
MPQRDSLLLRRQLLLALASGGLLGATGSKFLAACASIEPEAPSCHNGREPVRRCMSRQAMENTTRSSCQGLSNRPTPETPPPRESLLMDNGCLPAELACDGCCTPAAAEGEPQPDGSCCYYHCPGSCCGRPFIVAGAPRTAAVVTRADWLEAQAAPLAAAGTLRTRIVREWLSDAALEHASVAAFSLELLAFAAPAHMLEDAMRAGLDEVAHARACFSEAARYERTARGPGALAVHDVRAATTLAAAVRCTFLEGCIGETQAALIARHAAALAQDPRARDVLEQIARDEARHAELAWRFVAWALDKDPSLYTLLDRALAHAHAEITVPPERDSAEIRAARHAAGRLTEAERRALAHEALCDVVAPCWRALTALPLSAT